MKNDPQKKVNLPSILIILSIILLTVFYYATKQHKVEKQIKITTIEESYPLPKNESEKIFKKTETKSESEEVLYLSVGQKASINDLEITLNKINTDNRCPFDVQCITAGEVNVNITISNKISSLTTDYSWDKDPIDFGDNLIQITEAKPEKISTAEIKSEDYKIGFLIKKKAQLPKIKEL